ncbi:unnamed protein product [Ilex paraguariensis]|uniref:Uncharacterized protein n=1 Tax=Ilex paraguariensis TaxID=185542 RepID=A0ABC8U1E9_9AQUA
MDDWKIAFERGLQEEICVQAVKSFPNNEPDFSHEFVQISQNTRSPQGPQAYPNGADLQIGLSEHQPMVDFDVTCNGGNIVITGQSDIPVIGSEKNINKISPLLSPEFLPQLFGMKLNDVAKCLGGNAVSRTMLKRVKHKIWKWLFHKAKMVGNDLPKLNRGNESIRVIEGALC